MFLYRCGSAEGLDAGRHCLQQWGFRRCEDICWIKTNKEQRRAASVRQDTQAVLQHTKVVTSRFSANASRSHSTAAMCNGYRTCGIAYGPDSVTTCVCGCVRLLVCMPVIACTTSQVLHAMVRITDPFEVYISFGSVGGRC